MRIAGFIIGMVGFLLCITVIGAVIGIPLMIIGTGMMFFGGRRRTIINNVITVQNAPSLSSADGPNTPLASRIGDTSLGAPPSPASVDFKSGT